MPDIDALLQNKRLLLIIAAAAALLLLILLLILAAVSGGDNDAQGTQNYTLQKDADPLQPFDMNEVQVPDEMQKVLSLCLHYSRIPPAAWSREEIMRFWIDPKELAIEQLEKQLEDHMAEMMKEIPGK
jgi:hypothetical protein